MALLKRLSSKVSYLKGQYNKIELFLTRILIILAKPSILCLNEIKIDDKKLVQEGVKDQIA